MKKYLAIILSVCLLAVIASAFALPASAETAPDISGYVTDGLKAFYTAAYHSEDGKTWLDASGNNISIDLSSYNTDNNYFDAEKGVFVNNATKVFFPSEIVSLISSGKFTTEMVIKGTDVTGNSYGTYMNCSNDSYSMFIRLTALPTIYTEFKNGTNPRPKVEITDKNFFKDSTITVTFDSEAGICSMYVNGELLQAVTTAAAITVDNFFFGHEDATRSHNTEFANFRFYDRALTAEEVAANYAADGVEIIPSDESSDEPGLSSEEPDETAETDTSDETPKTGDAGLSALAVLAVISLAGVAVFKKK